MTQRLGVVGVKKTCSMALGDTGITPLEHTGAYAHFANGGKTARPYGILEMFNSKGDLIYSRDRDEPPPAQVLSRRVVEDMNQMMQAVVTNGTAPKAMLDFTTAVGKTGTSSSYRDAWFVGFTGALVTGVWVGHDDFRPMPGRHRRQPAGAGLARLHAGGAQELPRHSADPGPRPAPQPGGRSAAAGRAQADRSGDGAGADGPGHPEPSNLMPDQTNVALKKLADTMRQAAGVQPTPASVTPASVPAAGASPPAAPAVPGRQSAATRAKATPPTGTGAACRSARRWRAPAAVILSDRGPNGEIAA